MLTKNQLEGEKMSGPSKRIPKNSIFIIIKFDSRDQVIKFLADPQYQNAYSKITNIGLTKGGKVEYFKSFKS